MAPMSDRGRMEGQVVFELKPELHQGRVDVPKVDGRRWVKAGQ